MAGQLANALPKDVEFSLHHMSTPPTRCGAIFSPPSGQKPERTYCENQFLAVSIKTKDSHENPARILVYAIEIYIYTTARLTTIFVSKADSTGYVYLLNLPKGASSPLKSISSIFISWLVESRRRPGKKLVVSLFARAQDQYLFPGSIENAKKHVLDDRSLVKWWCRVLDATIVVEQPKNRIEVQDSDFPGSAPQPPQGYVIVPGFDKHETTTFLPASHKSLPQGSKRWETGQHPLHVIAPEPAAPPRCLVPHFPDDPKSRFLDDLDEELPELSNGQVEVSPSKKGSGQWKSVKSLDQFWEMMAFRQECSSGRLVGFIWVVFDTLGEDDSSGGLQDLVDEDVPSSQSTTSSTPLQRSSTSERRKPRPLTGVIYPRLPRVKSSASDNKSEKSKYYYWPRETRSEVVLDGKGYERGHDLLLRLDFANLDVALSSTQKWIEEVEAIAAQPGGWNRLVVGKRVEPQSSRMTVQDDIRTVGNANGSVSVNTLDMNVLRKKRKPAASENSSENTVTSGQANAIPISSIRKKPKPL